MDNSTFGSTNTSMKNNIIQVLSEDLSLSAKQTHSRLQRQYATTSTYQATHKTLKQMVEEGILKKMNLFIPLTQAGLRALKITQKNSRK